MNEEIKNIHRQLLNALKTIDIRHSEYKMDGFAALKGDKYNNKLMVVGRAVNGWGDPNGWSPSKIDNGKDVGKILDEMSKAPKSSNGCPMYWVTDQWGLNERDDNGDKFYNTARSAFWRTIKGVATDTNLDISPNDNDWPSYIAWSNLYKISKHKSGNPPWWLCQMQLEHCIKLLIEEIKLFKPKRILFLTGRDWAEPFMNIVNFEKDNPPFPNLKYIETSGLIHLEGLQSSPRVVIAPHPQGKPEKVIIENVLRCFNKI